MEDKYIMENLLNIIKTMAGLYEHASIESPTDNIHQTFSKQLQDTLHMQHELYTKMSDKGWYKTEKAETKQISKTASKYKSIN